VSNILLNVKKIVVRYEKAEVLKGISLEMREGSIVTIIGANGAGKTTTLRAISGIVKILSGEIEFLSQKIDFLAASQIVGIGIAHVLEGRRVFPFMSVRDNLLMGAYLIRDKRMIKRDMDEVLEHFPRLKERLKQRAGSLSGGEQQMLAVGRALMTHPKLVLMDEPSLGLSPILVEEIGKIIKELNEIRRVGILLVEQNARMALSLAEYAYVLETGRVTVSGEGASLARDDHVKKAYLGG
jgi:branched-chain amino acid transport system ATP-binding protein